jgi:hypothetical protein
MTEIEIGDDYLVADDEEYQNTMVAEEVPERLSPVNRTVYGIEVIEEFGDGSSRTWTWNEEAFLSLLRGDVIEEVIHVHPIDVKEFIRQTVSFPGEDVIATAHDSLGMTGTYELTIKTSLTSDEMDEINERFHIIEIYGFDADHFDKNPQDESSLGLILDTNTYVG